MDWADTYKYSPWQIDYLDKVFPDSVNKKLSPDRFSKPDKR